MNSADYEEMLQLAARITELASLEGELKGKEWKSAKRLHDEAEQGFSAQMKTFTDASLEEGQSWSNKPNEVNADLDDLEMRVDPSWYPAIAYTREKLVPFVTKESARTPLQRKLLKRLPLAIGVILVFAYLAVRFFSGVSVNNPLKTAAGLKERAAAFEKAVRYDDFMSTRVRRGGLFKGILFWPIEPTQDEIDGAAEFAGIVLEGQSVLSENGVACRPLVTGYSDTLSEAQIDYIGSVADVVRDETVQWETPASTTLLNLMRTEPIC